MDTTGEQEEVTERTRRALEGNRQQNGKMTADVCEAVHSRHPTSGTLPSTTLIAGVSPPALFSSLLFLSAVLKLKQATESIL